MASRRVGAAVVIDPEGEGYRSADHRPPGASSSALAGWLVSGCGSASACAAPPPASEEEIAAAMPSVAITSRSPRASGSSRAHARQLVADDAAEHER